jgi:hypothetical protein
MQPPDTSNSGSGLGVSLAMATTAGLVSLIPQLTEWFQLGTAILAFIAAAVALYKAIKK